MNKYKLRPGDLLVSPPYTIILVKKTKKFWYYHYKGMMCRISCAKLWEILDTRPKLVVEYSKGTKGRRMRKENRTLDLHGQKHKDALDSLRSFLNFVNLPCKVITGNSRKLKTAVKGVIVSEYGWFPIDDPAPHEGCLTVFESEI